MSLKPIEDFHASMLVTTNNEMYRVAGLANLSLTSRVQFG